MAKLIGWVIVLAALAGLIALVGRKVYRWWHKERHSEG